MYNINDYIIHKNNNIYQLIKINTNTCTLINIHNQEVMTANINEIVRKVLTVKELMEVIERIPYIRTLEITSERYRQELYQKSMDKYDEIEWIKLIKTIYIRLKRNQAQNYEQEYFKSAKKIFHNEISLLLKIPLNDIETYIKDKLMDF